MNRGKRFISSMAIMIACMLSVLIGQLPVSVHATEESRKTVRVGYVNALNYE